MVSREYVEGFVKACEARVDPSTVIMALAQHKTAQEAQPATNTEGLYSTHGGELPQSTLDYLRDNGMATSIFKPSSGLKRVVGNASRAAAAFPVKPLSGWQKFLLNF